MRIVQVVGHPDDQTAEFDSRVDHEVTLTPRARRLARESDLVIAHGALAARVSTFANGRSAPVVLRPRPTRPSRQPTPRVHRGIAAVAVRNEDQANWFRARVPPSLVWILDDDDADGWLDLARRLLGVVSSAIAGGCQSTIRLRPAAVRAIGDDLYVAGPGSGQPVLRLTGFGPELWSLFSEDPDVDHALRAIAMRTGAPAAQVERETAAFALQLVELGLAEQT